MIIEKICSFLLSLVSPLDDYADSLAGLTTLFSYLGVFNDIINVPLLFSAICIFFSTTLLTGIVKFVIKLIRG